MLATLKCFFGLHHWYDTMPAAVHRHLACRDCGVRVIRQGARGYSPIDRAWLREGRERGPEG